MLEWQAKLSSAEEPENPAWKEAFETFVPDWKSAECAGDLSFI